MLDGTSAWCGTMWGISEQVGPRVADYVGAKQLEEDFISGQKTETSPTQDNCERANRDFHPSIEATFKGPREGNRRRSP